MSGGVRSSEIILQVAHVKNKKCEGVLLMMPERMAWMLQSKSTVSLSHNYADIKTQKISPESKDKVQLQVLMHDGSADTFHFVNPLGKEAQLKDREDVKEILQNLLPQFRTKVSGELQSKQKLLNEDPQLFDLYKELVVGNVMTADEFWASRNMVVSDASGNKQEVGVSSSVLSDIKPEADGCNVLRYNITADKIESIFKLYPSVKKIHSEFVRSQEDEKEFWTRFCQSHYVHLDQSTATSSADLFAASAKIDLSELKKDLERPVNNPLIDLDTITDSDTRSKLNVVTDTTVASVAPMSAENVLRNLNVHSAKILKTCESQSQDKQPGGTSGLKSAGVTLLENSESVVVKRRKIQEKLVLDDLGDGEERTGSENGEAASNRKTQTVLRLERAERDKYLTGPTPLTVQQYNTNEDLQAACQYTAHDMLAWSPSLTQNLSSGLALGILGDLSPGGAMMLDATRQHSSDLLSADRADELRRLYNALNELLRHFWCCFPVSSIDLENKLTRTKDSLVKFHQTKINGFKQNIRDSSFVNVTAHMEEMLQAAYEKYSIWVKRQPVKKS